MSLLKWYKGELEKRGKDVSRFSDEQLTLTLGKELEAKYGPQKIKEYPEFSSLYKGATNRYKAKSLGRDGFFGGLKEIPAGIGQGIDETQGMIFGGLSAAAKTVGLDSASDYLMDKAMDNMAESQVRAPTIQSIGDVTNTGDFFRYLSGGLGRVVPSGATMLATGGIGGFAGKQLLKKSLAGPALRKYIKNKEAKNLKSELGKKWVDLSDEAKDIAGAYAFGKSMTGTTLASSGTMGLGEVYTSLYPYTQLDPQHKDYISPEDALQSSWGFGLAIGSLDSFLPSIVGGQIQRKFFKGAVPTPERLAQADKFVKKNILSLTAKGVGVEASTEATQEYLNVVAEKFARGEDKAFNPFEFTQEEIMMMVDGGILGALGGTVFGAGGGVIENWQTSRDEATYEKKLQERRESMTKEQLELMDSFDDLAGRVSTASGFVKGDRVTDQDGRTFTYEGDDNIPGMSLVSYELESGEKASTRVISSQLSRAIEPQKVEEPEPTVTTDPVTGFKEDVGREKQEEVKEEEVKEKDLKKSDVDKIKVGYAIRGKTDRTQSGGGVTYPIIGIVTKVDEETFTVKDRQGNEQVMSKSAGLFFTKKGKDAYDRLVAKEKKKTDRQAVEEEFRAKRDATKTVNLAEDVTVDIKSVDAKAHELIFQQVEELTSEQLKDPKAIAKLISTESYNEWVKEFYPPGQGVSKLDMAQAFVNAEPSIFPAGRLTKGDIKQEEARALAKQAEYARQDERERREAEQRTKRVSGLRDRFQSNRKLQVLTLDGPQSFNTWSNDQVQRRIRGEQFTRLQPVTREQFEAAKQKDQNRAAIKAEDPSYNLIRFAETYDGYIEQLEALNDTVHGNIEELINNGDEGAMRRFVASVGIKVEDDTPPTAESPTAESPEPVNGRQLSELPELVDGKYEVEYTDGNKIRKTIFIVDDLLRTGSNEGITKRPTSLGQAIFERFDKKGFGAKLYDSFKVTTPNNESIDFSFDGVELTFKLQNPVTYPVYGLNENNGIWRYAGGETNTLTDKEHLQVVRDLDFTDRVIKWKEFKIEVLEGIQGRVVLRDGTAKLPKESGTKKKSKAVVVIRHKSGLIIVRSINPDGTIRELKRPKTDVVSLLSSAQGIKFDDLPKGFEVVGGALFDARAGDFRAEFQTLEEYQEWVGSFKKVKEIRSSQTTSSKLEKARSLFNEFENGANLTDQEISLLDSAFAKDSDGNFQLNEDGSPIFDPSIGYYTNSTAKYAGVKINYALDNGIVVGDSPVTQAIKAANEYAAALEENRDIKRAKYSPPERVDQLVKDLQILFPDLVSKQGAKAAAKAFLIAVFEHSLVTQRSVAAQSIDVQISGDDGSAQSVQDIIPDGMVATPEISAQINEAEGEPHWKDYEEFFEQFLTNSTLEFDQLNKLFKVFFPEGTREQLQILHEHGKELIDAGAVTFEDLINTNRGSIIWNTDNQPRKKKDFSKHVNPEDLHFFGTLGKNGEPNFETEKAYWAFVQWIGTYNQLPVAQEGEKVKAKKPSSKRKPKPKKVKTYEQLLPTIEESLEAPRGVVDALMKKPVGRKSDLVDFNDEGVNIATGGFSGAEVIDMLTKSESPVVSRLAKKLKDVDFGTLRIGYRRSMGKYTRGQYTHRHGSVPNSTIGGISINSNAPDNVIVHEIMHALTINEIYNNSKLVDGNTVFNNSDIKRLYEIWDLASDEFNNNREKYKDIDPEDTRLSLALGDFREFIADLYTDYRLQEFLRRLEGDGKSLFEEIIDILAKILGFDAEGKTLLEESFRSLDSYLESRREPQEQTEILDEATADQPVNPDGTVNTEETLSLFESEIQNYRKLGRVPNIDYALKQFLKGLKAEGIDLGYVDDSLRESLTEAFAYMLRAARTFDSVKQIEAIKGFFSSFTDMFDFDAVDSDKLAENVINGLSISQPFMDSELLTDLEALLAGETEGNKQFATFGRVAFEEFGRHAYEEVLGKKPKNINLVQLVAEVTGVELPPIATGLSEWQIDAVLAEEDGGGFGVPMITDADFNDVKGMVDSLPGDSIHITKSDSEDAYRFSDEKAKLRTMPIASDKEISIEQAEKNRMVEQEVIGMDFEGVQPFSGYVLERIVDIVNSDPLVDQKNRDWVNSLADVLRRGMKQSGKLVPVFTDVDLPQPRNGITRAIYDPVKEAIVVDSNFFRGDRDSATGFFNITGDKTKDVLMISLLHEIWHSVMEAPITAHEKLIIENKESTSDFKETYDLINEVIQEIRQAPGSGQFGFLGLDQPVSEVLNRAWTRKDFAKWLSETKVSSSLSSRISKKGVVESLMDALYAAYLKVLQLFGIDVKDGTALKALLDLSKTLEAEYQKTQPDVFMEGKSPIRNPEPKIDELPRHQMDIDDLENMLEDGVYENTAVDFDGTWTQERELPVIVSISGVSRGRFIEHNKYYRTRGVGRIAKVSIDLDMLIPEGKEKAVELIAKLRKSYPAVNFEVLGKVKKGELTSQNLANATGVDQDSARDVIREMNERDSLFADWLRQEKGVKAVGKNGIFKVSFSSLEKYQNLETAVEYINWWSNPDVSIDYEQLRLATEQTKQPLIIKSTQQQVTTADAILGTGTGETREMFIVTGLESNPVTLSSNEIESIMRIKGTPSRVVRILLDDRGVPQSRTVRRLSTNVLQYKVKEDGKTLYIDVDQLEQYDSRDIISMSDDQMTFDFLGENKTKESKPETDQPEVVRDITPKALTAMIAKNIYWGGDDFGIDAQLVKAIHKKTGIPSRRIRQELDTLHRMFDYTPIRYREQFIDNAMRGVKKYYGRGQGMTDLPFADDVLQSEIDADEVPLTGDKVNQDANMRANGMMEIASINEYLGALTVAAPRIREIYQNEKLSIDDILSLLKLGRSPQKQLDTVSGRYEDLGTMSTIESFRGNENMTQEARERALHRISVAEYRAKKTRADNIDLILKNSERLEELEAYKPDAGTIFNIAKTGDKLKVQIEKLADNLLLAIEDGSDPTLDPVLSAAMELGITVSNRDFTPDVDSILEIVGKDGSKIKRLSSDFLADITGDIASMNISSVKDIYSYLVADGRLGDGRELIVASLLANTKEGLEQIGYRKLATSDDLVKKRGLLDKLTDIYNANPVQLAQIKQIVTGGNYPAEGAEAAVIEEFITRREEHFTLVDANRALEQQNAALEAMSDGLKQAGTKMKIYLGYNPTTHIGNGTEIPHMRREGDGYVMDKFTVEYNNSMKPKDFEGIKKVIHNNTEYLKDPKSPVGMPEYNQVKRATMQAQTMIIHRQHEEASGGMKSYLLKSNQELFTTMGVGGREIARMQIEADIATRKEMPAVMAGASNWNRAVLNAAEAMGYKGNENKFLDEIYGPVQKWNEDNPFYSGMDRSAFEKEIWKYASNLAGIPIDSEAKESFIKFLEANEYMSSLFQQIGKRYGLKIENDKRKTINYLTGELEPIFRDAITRGFSTSGRKLKSSAINLIINEMNPMGWGRTENTVEGDKVTYSIKGLREIVTDKTKTQKEKNQEVDNWIAEHVNNKVLMDFIYPYIKNTSSKAMFKSPNNKFIGRTYLEQAWEKSEGEGAERFISWIDNLYRSLPRKKDGSDYVKFKMGILSSFNSAHSKLSASISNYGSRGDNKAYAMAHALMDSRAQDAIIPIEFLQYESYDEVSARRQLNQIIGHSFYGRSGKRLMSAVERLGEDLKAKANKLNVDARELGAVVSNSGVPKMSRSQKDKLALAYEGDDSIQGKTGREKLNNLISAAKRLKDFEYAKNQLNLYMDSDAGPLKDMSFVHEMVGTMAFLILQQPKSGLTNLLSLGDQMVVYKGFNKYSLRATKDSVKSLLSSFFGGILENFGAEIGYDRYAEWTMDWYHQASAHEVGFNNYRLNLGARATKRSSKIDMIKLNLLRQGKQILNYAPYKDGRKRPPVSWRSLFFHPFTYLSNLSSHSVGVAVVRMVDGMVRETAAFIEKENTARLEQGLPPLPSDYQVTPEDLALTDKQWGSSKEAYEYINNSIELRGLGTISSLARDYIERKKQGNQPTVLTKDQALAITSIGLHDVVMEGGFISRPSASYTNNVVRAAFPLQGWSFAKVNQMNKSSQNQEKMAMEAAATMRTLFVIAGWLVPVGMLFTFAMDEYDEEILGKPSSLRPAPLSTALPIFGPFIEDNPAGNAMAMIERLSRAGNVYGVAFDVIGNIFAQIDPYSHQRGFSLDTRVLLMSQILNTTDALKNLIHSRDFDYQLVGRPLMYTFGLNGLLQQTQAVTNLFGLDNNERRVSNMIGNRNKVRAGLAALEIERRPMVSGSFKATPFSVQIRKMERAAYADDSESFREAYRNAVEIAIERGDTEPEKEVLKSFKRRNLRTGISKYVMTDNEWERLLNVYSSDQQKSLRHAMNMHNKYIDILERSTAVTFEPVIPSIPKAKETPYQYPLSYEDIIKRSLAY